MKKDCFLRTMQLSLLLTFVACTNTTPIVAPTKPIVPPVVVLPSDTAHTKPGDGVYYTVKTRSTQSVNIWTTYTAKTIDHLLGFSYAKDPALSSYGGYKVNQSTATGFFRVEKIGSRWWLVDPDGYPFIHRGVACFVAGSSPNQKGTMQYKYGTTDNWVKAESDSLRLNGFNGTGAWSDVDLIRNSTKPLVYTVIINPMANYRAQHVLKFGGSYPAGTCDWHGYYHDVAMVFDPGFDTQVLNSLYVISKYANDKNLLGYFTDNEIAWDNYALDNSIQYLALTDPGYIAAKSWLDSRKGKNTTLADITAADRLAFSGYYFETYMKKVTTALHKYDPNHLYLGCRFNGDELGNSEVFRVAGQYMDVVSINHYNKWEPASSVMTNWASWSGKPFIITEFYTKADDAGLPNKTGGGWIVPTALDRGYFYQNFCTELLRSKACVGWHWFCYLDNDPTDLTTITNNPSNVDSNKGILNGNFKPYTSLVDNMKQFNTHVYELTQFFDK
jgi:hypothetical protein